MRWFSLTAARSGDLNGTLLATRGMYKGTPGRVAWRRPLTVGLLGALVSGCGPNWQPVPLVRPAPLDRKQVLEFRTRDSLVRLHGVEFARDSLSGIPWLEHLSCDTCRVRFALADISNARTGNPGAGAWNIALPSLAGLGFLVGIWLTWPREGT